MNARVVIALMALAGLAGAADLPTGEELMTRHVEATGGSAAWRSVKTQEMHASTEVVGQGVKGKLSSWIEGGNRSRTVMEFDGLGKIDSGVTADGKAWSTSAMQGPRVLDGAERSQALRSVRFNVYADWKPVYSSLKTEAAEDINGQPAWRVTASLKDGDKPETLWFDQKTGRHIRTRMNVVTQMGEIPVDTNISDYRKVGSLQLPFLIEQKLGPQTIRTTVDSIQLDAPMESSRFEPPADIKALLAKAP